MNDMSLSELPIGKDAQQYPEHLSEQTSGRDSLHIYTVSSFEGKTSKSSRKIQLRANHFAIKINTPEGKIYHYDFSFIFADKKEVKKSDQKLLLEAIQRLKGKYPEIFNHAIVFDGFKNVYTCKKMDFTSDDSEGDVEIKEHTANRKKPEIKVILKYARDINANFEVKEYCEHGTTETKPYHAIQALNIILNMKPLD